MQALSTELKAVIGRRLEVANTSEVLAIANALCSVDDFNILRTAPAAAVTTRDQATEQPRFHPMLDNGKRYGTLDHSTGLVWTYENVPGGRMSWADAKKAVADLSFGFISGWRLPTVRELLTLVDYERHDPAIDTEHFRCEPSLYWTSIPLASSPSVFAWSVFFYNGDSLWNGQNFECFVRAVRSSQ